MKPAIHSLRANHIHGGGYRKLRLMEERRGQYSKNREKTLDKTSRHVVDFECNWGKYSLQGRKDSIMNTLERIKKEHENVLNEVHGGFVFFLHPSDYYVNMISENTCEIVWEMTGTLETIEYQSPDDLVDYLKKEFLRLEKGYVGAP